MINQDPLGAQHSQMDDDGGEEQQHFQHVIQSYQQYASFHQTRQRGVNRRLENLLRGEKTSSRTATSSCRGGAAAVAVDATQAAVNPHYPTLQSILPPSLRIQPSGTTSNNTAVPEECRNYQKEFSSAAIRNQFFLDNILKYSHQETSQDVLRRWRQQQHGCSSCTTHDDDDNRTTENFSCKIEWTTEERISKIDSVLKSVARDWSSEGHGERSVVYDRMIRALQRYLPLSNFRPRDDDDDDNEFEKQLVDIDDSRATTRASTKIAATLTQHRVAVPGSGLGRLAWEIYSRGYSVQGSDFSLPMLLASDFILNGCGGRGRDSFQQFTICPWLAETKNVLSFRNRIRTVIVPDVDPTAVDHSNIDDGQAVPEFTMLAGEFLHLYSHHLPEYGGMCDGGSNNLHQYPSSRRHPHHRLPESTKKFNAVVCSFFLDTAPSLPHYLLTMYHMLEDGGLFIHCGPLMYHWSGHGALLPGDDGIGVSNYDVCSGGKNGSAYHERNKHLDSRYLTSIDYTWEEVRYMIVHCGFELLEEELQIPAHYTLDRLSMMKVGYDCVFCVARKKVANR